jgi:hypothetical protein
MGQVTNRSAAIIDACGADLDKTQRRVKGI